MQDVESSISIATRTSQPATFQIYTHKNIKFLLSGLSYSNKISM